MTDTLERSITALSHLPSPLQWSDVERRTASFESLPADAAQRRSPSRLVAGLVAAALLIVGVVIAQQRNPVDQDIRTDTGGPATSRPGPTTSIVPTESIVLSSLFRSLAVQGPTAVLVVDGGNGQVGGSPVAWLVDVTRPETARRVDVELSGTYSLLSGTATDQGFYVSARRCPTDPPEESTPESDLQVNPCIQEAFDVFYVDVESGVSQIVGQGMMPGPDADIEASLFLLGEVGDGAYLHASSGRESFVVSSHAPPRRVDTAPSAREICDDGRANLYSVNVGDSGNPGTPAVPVASRVALYQLVGDEWLPRAAPSGSPSTAFASPTACTDSIVTFNTPDEATEGVLVLDLGGDSPSWRRIPVPPVPSDTTSVMASANPLGITLDVSGPEGNSYYLWNDATNEWTPFDPSAPSGVPVQGGMLTRQPIGGSDEGQVSLVGSSDRAAAGDAERPPSVDVDPLEFGGAPSDEFLRDDPGGQVFREQLDSGWTAIAVLDDGRAAYAPTRFFMRPSPGRVATAVDADANPVGYVITPNVFVTRAEFESPEFDLETTVRDYYGFDTELADKLLREIEGAGGLSEPDPIPKMRDDE